MTHRSGVTIFFCFIVVLLLSGCGTLFRGLNQDLPISTIPSGAIAKIGDKQCVTPCTLRVSRKTDSVTIMKDGQTAIFEVDYRKSVWFFWDAVFGGIFIVPAIDCIIGGVYDLKPVKIDLYKERVLLYPNQMVGQMAAPMSQPGYAGKQPFPTITCDIDALPNAKTGRINNSYAIVIGVEQYRQGIPRADYATHDAEMMTKYLTEVMGYPEENVVTLLNENALRSDFEKYFERWLANTVEKDGTVFVYFAGRGAPDAKNGDIYLVPHDGDALFLDQTAYPLKRLYAALGKLPAKKIIVVLDSNFSGAGSRSIAARGNRPLGVSLPGLASLSKNIVTLSATTGDQTASAYDDKGHGLLTYFMLKGIKSENVIRQDGSLKVNDLYSYVRAYVERIAKHKYMNEQCPQLIEAKK
jgi:hypothetical protein